MPELTAIWFVGAIICFIAVNLNLYSVHRSFNNPSIITLNSNLEPLNLYWSIEQSRLIAIGSGLSLKQYQQLDYKKATRSAFLFGTLMLPLSWFGLGIVVVYFMSVHYFAKSRLEHNIFESDLTKKLLMESETRILINDFCELVGVKLYDT